MYPNALKRLADLIRSPVVVIAWILASGAWNDTQPWNDTQLWKDAA